jgi:hypothetical protein
VAFAQEPDCSDRTGGRGVRPLQSGVARGWEAGAGHRISAPRQATKIGEGLIKAAEVVRAREAQRSALERRARRT